MNRKQRAIVVVIGVIATLMLLFPPFYIQYRTGVIDNLGYHCLFDPPLSKGMTGFVHIPTLLMQMFGLLVVGFSALVVAGAKSKIDRKTSIPEKSILMGGGEVDLDTSKINSQNSETMLKGNRTMLHVMKRLGITILAFLISGVLVALWQEYLPATGLSGSFMAIAAVALVFGAWKWSASFK